ncbi:MAG: NAD(P)-dependent oxidoreductase, partial [Betaproteobacteria bacterium]|nr:NAD(P)-dependent oxidoreductase [Betaproteobacteria bacterium]
MMASELRLGFIGFGEAASRFAQDLSQAGLQPIAAYSPSAANAGADDPSRRKAADAGVELVPTLKALCQRSTLVVSLTPGKLALPVLRKVRRHLKAHHIYVDASTASVKDMERAAQMLEGGAAFVDAAVMDPVPMNGIKVLTVASGSHAEKFRALLAPYGMNIQVVGEKAGAASAMKLLRSVCMKGLAALLLESLEAAQRYGIADALTADMARFINGRPFEDVMKRFVCGTAIHAGRRVHEVSEAMALLKSLGASTRMTKSTRETLQSIEAMGLRERFGAREPDTMAPVLEAIIESRKKHAGDAKEASSG